MQWSGWCWEILSCPMGSYSKMVRRGQKSKTWKSSLLFSSLLYYFLFPYLALLSLSFFFFWKCIHSDLPLLQVMSMLDPKIVKMFYFTGTKHTTPNCPIDLRPDLNPSSGAQSYDSSGIGCSKSAIYNIPFFLGRMGPRYSEWSVNAHEARPGHHLQVSN